MPDPGGNRSGVHRQLAQAQKEGQRVNRLMEQEREGRKRETRRANTLQLENDDLRVEMTLRESAIRAGVKDVSYVLDQLRQETAGKDEAALAGFDEVKWFGELRKQKPYLFGEAIVPATTGTTPPPGGQPAPTAPGTDPNSQPFNAKTATREQIEARMRQLKLKPIHR